MLHQLEKLDADGLFSDANGSFMMTGNAMPPVSSFKMLKNRVCERLRVAGRHQVDAAWVWHPQLPNGRRVTRDQGASRGQDLEDFVGNDAGCLFRFAKNAET